MKNKDLKKQLSNEYKKLTPDVYEKVKRTPINRLLTIDSPEQANRRRVALTLVCISFVILAVLVVSLFSYMIVPAKKTITYNYVYIHTNVEKPAPGTTKSYGAVIDDDTNSLICIINETDGTKLDIENKTIYDFATFLNIEDGDTLSTSILATNEERNSSASMKINDILADFLTKNSINANKVNTSLSISVLVSFIKINNPESTLEAQDGTEAIINQYIYMASKI